MENEPIAEVFGVPITNPEAQLNAYGIPVVEVIQEQNIDTLVRLGANLNEMWESHKRLVKAFADALDLCGAALSSKGVTTPYKTPDGCSVKFQAYPRFSR